MDWLHRARWRWRGAWLRPAFLVLTGADTVIATQLPAAGDSASPVGMLLLAAILNLIAVLALVLPLGWTVRRLRPQLPQVVARDRAGTLAVILVTAGFLGFGLANRAQVQADRAALREARQAAVAWIAARAPAAFRPGLARSDTFTIEPGSVYRTCVPNRAATRTFCVIVRRHMPRGQRVVFDGYEPNSVFSEGVG